MGTGHFRRFPNRRFIFIDAFCFPAFYPHPYTATTIRILTPITDMLMCAWL